MPASRAFTVTTTNDRQNMMCAIRIVPKPSWPPKPAATNSASSEEPITISGEAIGRKISRLRRRTGRANAVPDQGERGQRAEDGRDRTWPAARSAMLRTTASHMLGSAAGVEPVVQGEPVERGRPARLSGSLKHIRMTMKIGTNM